MPSTPPPLWNGRLAGDDHDWLIEDTLAPPRPKPEPAPPPEPPKRRGRTIAILCVSLVALLGAAFAGTRLAGQDDPADAELATVKGGDVAETRINKIYAAVNEGVVSVQVSQGAGAASGTGFVVSGDGTIVTNAHVVSSADEVQVRFKDDGKLVEAKVAGSDPSSDLAVLRVDPSDVDKLKVLPIADSDKVEVGDVAIAVGFPLGLDKTATSGIISGLGREIEAPNGFSIDEVIQTDAPINPGNSGGPLLDARGRVIGVNSQIATAGSQGNVGIGFAVPSNTVREIVPQLKRGARIERPYLGVSTGAAIGRRGAVVREVRPGGPAAKAGLRPSTAADGSGGDVIVSVAGRRVVGPDDVAAAIDGRRPGDEVEVEVTRDGKKRTVKVELGERPTRVGP